MRTSPCRSHWQILTDEQGALNQQKDDFAGGRLDAMQKDQTGVSRPNRILTEKTLPPFPRSYTRPIFLLKNMSSTRDQTPQTFPRTSKALAFSF